jgi:hypothetical protein
MAMYQTISIEVPEPRAQSPLNTATGPHSDQTHPHRNMNTKESDKLDLRHHHSLHDSILYI